LERVSLDEFGRQLLLEGGGVDKITAALVTKCETKPNAEWLRVRETGFDSETLKVGFASRTLKLGFAANGGEEAETELKSERAKEDLKIYDPAMAGD
jgi:hypothetical protein